MTDLVTLEARRKGFLKELVDLDRFPLQFTKITYHGDGGRSEGESIQWQKARYVLSIPTVELREEFSPQEIHDLHSMFRADGGESLYGTMIYYFMSSDSHSAVIATKAAEYAAFYGLGLDVFISYIKARKFIGVFAAIESYPQSGWDKVMKYIDDMLHDPTREEWSVAFDMPYFMRKACGENRDVDPMTILARIPGSNYIAAGLDKQKLLSSPVSQLPIGYARVIGEDQRDTFERQRCPEMPPRKYDRRPGVAIETTPPPLGEQHRSSSFEEVMLNEEEEEEQ